MKTSNILTICFALFATLILIPLAYAIFKQANIQPLKIKSPKLIVLFIVGNIIAVLLLAILQVVGDEVTAQVVGYLFICLSEPLIMLSFMIRYLRIRKIFEA